MQEKRFLLLFKVCAQLRVVTLVVLSIIQIGLNAVEAQELRFVQSFASPLLVNPAMTGDIPGRFRVSLIHRNQWSPALGAPIVSYSFGGDARFQIKGKSDYFALGILFFSDRFASYQTHINHMSVSTAYNKQINRNSSLQAGMHLGVSQRGVNYENFTFEDQFDGIKKYNQPSAEILPPNSLAHPELAFGLQFKTRYNKGRSFYIGTSGYHLIKSQVSYFSKIEDNNVPFSKENYLYRRFHVYAGLVVEQDKMRYNPSIKLASQGPLKDISLGGTIRRQFYDARLSAFYLGAWVIGGNNGSQFGLKSIAAMVGTELNGLIIGLSYDQLLHDYFKGVGGMVGFELSMTYIGNYENDFNFCPTF